MPPIGDQCILRSNEAAEDMFGTLILIYESIRRPKCHDQTNQSPSSTARIARSWIPSVITSKPAINDHFKTGQRSRAQDMTLFYRAGATFRKVCFVSS